MRPINLILSDVANLSFDEDYIEKLDRLMKELMNDEDPGRAMEPLLRFIENHPT